MSPASLLGVLNELGHDNGIGRIDLVENRFVGMKSRGVYETPGGTILLAAHRAIESITLDRGAGHLKDELMPRYAELIYNGFWFSPEREMLQALIDKSQEDVEGEVRLKLYKGNVIVTGRRSPKSLYSDALVTFEDDRGAYDQKDAEGFIRLNALRLGRWRRASAEPSPIGGAERSTAMPEFPAVRRRLVVFLPGFEAMPAIAHARRFVREARRTAPVYAMVLPDEVAISREGEVTARIVAAGAGDAATETELLVDSMDEIAASYAARGAMRRLATGYRALFDFAISGAAARFAATSWRYLIFFLFPLILPLAAVLLALLAWQVSASAATGLLVGVVLAVAFAWIAFSRLHLLLVMDDWTFAHDLAHRRQPDFEAALDRLAAWTANRASEGQFDEIVIAAHSLGAIAAVPLARRIVRMWAPLPPVGLLTVGSSLLKVALHPKADGCAMTWRRYRKANFLAGCPGAHRSDPFLQEPSR
jgi:hypothetical protein